MTTNYNHWNVEQDASNVCWAYFDRSDTSVNALNQVALTELEAIIDAVKKDKKIKGLVIGTAKASGFIAGADVTQFKDLDSVDDAVAFINQGQQVFEKLEKLKVPTVAMIDGFCLGGGLELSLACRYRIAEEGPKTRLGLPEVMLGIHPGWGGTVRLPQLIGPLKAMELILSGRALSAKAARKVGMVDAVVPKRQLKRAAAYYVKHKPAPHKPGFLKMLPNKAFLRPWIAKLLRKQVAKKAKQEHYPAPYAVIDNWVRDGAKGKKAFHAEVDSIADLIVHSETANNLLRVFFLQERLKSMAKDSDFDPRHVHVIGAGVMGGDIAAWCALRGMRVTLQDRSEAFLAPAMKRAHALFKRKLKKQRLIQAAMDRLTPDVAGHGVAKADVIIEAIFENLDAKQDLLRSLEANAKKDAVLATNTSTIPLEEISAVLKEPNRLVGIHFFNPVAKMQLIEVVSADKTDPTVTEKAIAFVRKIDRLPLPVKSCPGFLINRVLTPYLLEAMVLIEEGVPAVTIDQAAEDFGMPMGPVELADVIGLDICLHAANNLVSHYGGQVPERLTKMVEAGKLGKKSGKGFYTYKKGKVSKPKLQQQPTAELANRLVFRLINESAACLREGIVADADLLDTGMIFGTGFAPFRGGPMHYAKTLGFEELEDKSNELQEQFGERFKLDEGLNLNVLAVAPREVAEHAS